MPATFSWLDKTTDVSKPSRSGMTCEPLTDALGTDVLMSFQAASRVKTSAPLEKAQALKATVPGFGANLLASLAKYDRASSSWKTAQCSLLADSEPFSETWPRWGSMRNGECWERTIPAHLTSVTGSGLLLPTPAASSYGTNQGGAAGRTGKIRPSLDTMARKNIWPTPNSRDWKDSETQDNRKSVNLGTAVHQAAPWKQCHGCENFWCIKHQMHAHDCECQPIEQWNQSPYSTGGQLNPTWVEWLMAWPLGWTDCAASATDKFQQWQRSHGIR